MELLLYDGSFEGLLSAIFYVYEYSLTDVQIRSWDHAQDNLFGSSRFVDSDEEKAGRVWEGLKQRLSKTGTDQFYRSFLSEELFIEDHLLSYSRYAFASKSPIDSDFSHPAVMKLAKMAKQVGREKHRMEAFVRFQRTADDIYYAVIEPDYNVLPLIIWHFKDRYADQRWIIYDSKRKYALYYDLNTVETVEIQFNEGSSAGGPGIVSHEQEGLYQQLWKRYFHSVNIPARKNLKLHIRHMPKRYWNKLVEKKLG